MQITGELNAGLAADDFRIRKQARRKRRSDFKFKREVPSFGRNEFKKQTDNTRAKRLIKSAGNAIENLSREPESGGVRVAREGESQVQFDAAANRFGGENELRQAEDQQAPFFQAPNRRTVSDLAAAASGSNCLERKAAKGAEEIV